MSHQRLTSRRLVGASALLLACSPVLADVTIGTWEGENTDGWIDWGTQSPITFGTKYSHDTTTGVTNGTQSVKVDYGGGFNQNLAIKLWQPGNNQGNFFDYDQFAIDVTVPANAAAGWAEVYALWINTGTTGFQNFNDVITPIPPSEFPPPQRQWGWAAAGGGAQSATLVWNYGSAFDGLPNPGGDNRQTEIPTTTYVELILGTNSSDAAHGTFFFDNARFTSSRLAVDINGGSSPGTGHPKQRGFRGWNNLPTSGQNGDPPQNAYGTDTASQSFNTGIVASQNVDVTLKSRDVVGVSAPAYDTGGGATLNSFDYSIPGRELNDSGSFTPARDSVYRDVVVAETGLPSDGTNHRMEIEFTGLDPNTPYKVKFYAHDNSNQRNVAVFTDVTAQPLIFMPGANSTDGNFTPGDGSGGTQYAPAGQYIDGTTVPTFPNGNDFAAIELFATSDATGKLVFAETTVVGLSGPTQVLPVLNGFEIARDNRVWSGGTGTAWNTAANWTGNIPNAKGQVANFGNTTNASVDIDAPTTVGRLNFSGAAMTIGGASTLALDDNSINSTLSSAITGRTEINLTASSGNQTINAPLQLNKDTQVWVASAGSTLTTSNLQPSQVALTKVGAGTMAVNNVRANALRVFEGTVKVLADGSAGGVSVVKSLAVGASGKLDLSDNDLIVDYTGASVEGQVRQWVKDGRTPGSASGIFVTPGTPDDDKALAVADNAAWGKSSFNGINIDADTVVGKYTYFGDANLDGKVTGDDYLNVDANLGTGDSWLEGDFNMSGVTTGDDYLAVDANLGKGTSNPLPYAELKAEMVQLHRAMFGEEYLVKLALAESEGFGATVVPEPVSAGLLATACGCVVLGKRRRQARS